MRILATSPLSAAAVGGAYPGSEMLNQALRPATDNRPAAGGDRLPDQAIQLLEPFFPRLSLRRVHIDDQSAYGQWLLDKAGAVAITIGTTIYVAKGSYNPATVDGLALLGHELTHVQQFKDQGRGGFFWRYGTDYLRDRLTNHSSHWAAYHTIRAEREAEAMGAHIRSQLQGKLASCVSEVC